MRVLSLLLILAAAGLLSACGLRGSLERPPPLWGGPQAAIPDSQDAEDEDEDEDDDLSVFEDFDD
ncbi:MAG: lipoprotein [Maricaulaceae bacterium]|nr:lipoprotein [Maricaulaceae bacterium]